MKKIKYYFNTHTLRFDKVEVPLKVRLLQLFGFIAASIVTGVVIVAILFQYIDSPKEKLLRQQNESYRASYSVIQDRVRQLELQMSELESRDNEVYRSIFESSPIPDSARLKDIEALKEVRMIQNLSSSELLYNMISQLNNLSVRLAFQDKSYVEVGAMVKNKEKLLRAIPAIQPVKNEDLKQMASGYGYRSDPFTKIRKFHYGMDFTARTGTPIYATGDGVVYKADASLSGYGNHIEINHGYGYKTLYAHLSKYNCRPGQRVKRGDIIGYVGSTGRSQAPHLHYEVFKGSERVNPLNFYYGSISAKEYIEISKLANQENQSLD